MIYPTSSGVNDTTRYSARLIVAKTARHIKLNPNACSVDAV